MKDMKHFTFSILLLLSVFSSLKCYSQEENWNTVFSYLDGTWEQISHEGDPLYKWDTSTGWGYLFEDESLKQSILVNLTNRAYVALKFNVTMPGTYKFEFRHRLENKQDDVKVRLFYTIGGVLVGDTSNRVYVTDATSVDTQKQPALTITSNEFEIDEPGDYYFGYEVTSFDSDANYLYVGGFNLFRKDDGTAIEKQYMVTWEDTYNGSIVVKDENDKVLSSSDMVNEGTTIYIEDQPNEGYVLEKLTANGQNIIEEKSVVVSDNITLKATFTKLLYTLTFEQPEHGTISITPATTKLESGAQVEAGTVLFVTATPQDGYKLVSIMANNLDITRIKRFTMNEDVNVVATFESVGSSISCKEQDIVYYNTVTEDLHAGGNDVEIYNMSGILLVKKDNIEVLNLAGLPSGFYIAVVNGNVFKFMK